MEILLPRKDIAGMLYYRRGSEKKETAETDLLAFLIV